MLLRLLDKLGLNKPSVYPHLNSKRKMKLFIRTKNNTKELAMGANNSIKGFTLIEVMVSVTLFAMVMTLSLGAILSIIDGNKKAQAINSVANNLNFAVDSMVRDIKTGYSYSCNDNQIPTPDSTSVIGSDKNGCSGDAQDFISLISTISSEGPQKRGVRYSLQKDSTGRGSIYKTTSDESGNSYPVTSPEVDIQKLEFIVENYNTDFAQEDIGQPRVFLYIKGTAGINPTQASDFSIQTLISQRNLNLPK